MPAIKNKIYNIERVSWKKYGIEFLSIFIAVLSAFALNNWNDNRRDSNTENKIIAEISNGLRKDIEDIKTNIGGHQEGIRACKFWRNVIEGKQVALDSVEKHYLNLTRDFISIQNTSGYETLKSRGLELLKNDSLRSEIISLYEYDYKILRKFEEEYDEMQFHKNYFKELTIYLGPNLVFDEKGKVSKLDLPLEMSQTDKNILLTYLWKIQLNRSFVLHFYSDVATNVKQLLDRIES